MKKYGMLLAVMVLLLASLTGCGYQKVSSGYEGVKINTLGEGKGSITTVGVGKHFYSWKYEMKLFPLFKQNIVWTASATEGSKNNDSITFQSKESLTFRADVGLSYSVMPKRSKDLYIAYHKGIDEITGVDMRNSLRDAFNRLASARPVDGIYGSGKTEFIAAVEKDMRSYWQPQGIIIHKVYLVGEITPPPAVKESIAKKIQATQMAQQRRNEVEQSKAEADKKIEVARGDADSKNLATDAESYAITEKAKAEAGAIAVVNKQLAKSPAYVEYVKAKRWNGQLPTYMGGTSPIPMINVN